jgi:putative oxidoreductase
MLKTLAKAQPWAYQAMRIAAGFLFFCHGLQKFGLLGGRQVPLLSQVGAAGVIEVVGGLLIAIGVAVSPVAFICSGEMAVAFFQAHFPRAILPAQNGGELAALYCFVFLYIATRGRK